MRGRNISRARFAVAAGALVLSVHAFAADPGKGGEIYGQHCANCHGASGMSMIPGVPNFSRGEGLFRADRELEKVIREGAGVMPAFEGLLSYDDIRDVVAYLRTMY